LFTKDAVGVVDIGDVVVEILPKVHDSATPEASRAFLTDLLRFTSAENNIAVSTGAVAVGEQEVLEVVLSWALRLAASNMRGGLPRRYVPREEISATVRGRIDLRSIARAKPGKAFTPVIRHAPLSEDNAITRVLKWLLVRISQLTRSASTKRICSGLLSHLEHVASSTPILIDVDGISLYPLEQHWESLIGFARSLLQQDTPDPTRAGHKRSVAVLFTLHNLFEEALRRVFHEGLQHFGIYLRHPRAYLLHADAQGGHGAILRLRPDFVFSASDKSVIGIGDAKWKRILNSSGDVRISEDDAYQLTAYLTVLKGRCGFLFCPLTEDAKDAQIRKLGWKIGLDGLPIHLIAVHLPTIVSSRAEGAILRASLCRLVADSLLS
jgi:5-methylcytosine-specific restriction enzyme subunit McrC